MSKERIEEEKVWYDTPSGNIEINITSHNGELHTIIIDEDVVRLIKKKTDKFLDWYMCDKCKEMIDEEWYTSDTRSIVNEDEEITTCFCSDCGTVLEVIDK